MFPSTTENAVSFHHEDRDRSDSHLDGYEKARDDRALEEQAILPVRGGFEMQAFISKLLGWPAIVIVGKIILQTFAWGFFGFIESRGFIALPYSKAVWASSHTHTVI
ncbi:hypothetical protein B0H17DRAFT_1142070 [Mycena rosella]|uniref:Uncharacterized protein n=1 Tax=Mycena rosella TaxID=1033263 RepID=A0AAD7CYM8_MYCRO|nr:hypothetical protein B0H17DRAFT_1209583 [Mycena rosella]KAJ7669728.1 hypothetical protein B0H17DRAFT_1142070 [Mycena rosella]